jgi:hypothetical protein
VDNLLLIWTGEGGSHHEQHGFPNRPCALQWFHGVCRGLPRGGKAALFAGNRLIAAGRRNRAGVLRWRTR